MLSCVGWWAWGLSRPAGFLRGLLGAKGRWLWGWEEILGEIREQLKGMR